MKKQLIAASLAAAVGVTGLVGVGVANAATDTNSTNPMSGLVKAVATKFNLKEADVQSVFDEQRTKMMEERETQIKEDIAQLVTDDKITQEQADELNAKRAEIKAEHEAARESDTEKTREEMKSEMEAKRTELETWAKENAQSKHRGVRLS